MIYQYIIKNAFHGLPLFQLVGSLGLGVGSHPGLSNNDNSNSNNNNKILNDNNNNDNGHLGGSRHLGLQSSKTSHGMGENLELHTGFSKDKEP